MMRADLLNKVVLGILVAVGFVAFVMLFVHLGAPSPPELVPLSLEHNFNEDLEKAHFGTATISGFVRFSGARDVRAPIPTTADPRCPRPTVPDERLMLAPNGGVRNAVVRITLGVKGTYPPPIEAAILEHKDCRYQPRVLAIMRNQYLEIRNADPTVHDIEARIGHRTKFEHVLPQGADVVREFLTEGALMVTLRSNAHPWMEGFVQTSNHPFFAVTGDDGTYSIDRVPTGRYTIESWHETLGGLQQEIEVAEGAKLGVDFPYSDRQPN